VKKNPDISSSLSLNMLSELKRGLYVVVKNCSIHEGSHIIVVVVVKEILSAFVCFKSILNRHTSSVCCCVFY